MNRFATAAALMVGLLAAPWTLRAEMLGLRVMAGYGVKSLAPHDWGDLDSQQAASLDAEVKLPLFPFSVAAGYLSTSDEMKGTPKLEGTTTEISVGLRKTFEFGPVLPFVSAGLCQVDAEIETSTPSLGKVSDNAWGYWISGGLRYQLGHIFLIGVQARRSWAEVTFNGRDIEAGGTTILGEVGVGF